MEQNFVKTTELVIVALLVTITGIAQERNYINR